MFLIRFVFYFVLSFSILCIPVGNNEHLFDKLYSYVSPYAHEAIKSTKQKVSSTKKYSKKLYSNSEPMADDFVKTKAAAIKKKVDQLSDEAETYTKEEQERLQRILTDKE